MLMGLFHEEIVASLRNLPLDVCLVCARRITPKTSTEDISLRGTIVDNMAVGRTEKAFASRVSEAGAQSFRLQLAVKVAGGDILRGLVGRYKNKQGSGGHRDFIRAYC